MSDPECLTGCSKQIVSKKGCICISNPQKQSDGSYTCTVKCPEGIEGTKGVFSFFSNVETDEVLILKPQKTCLKSTYVKEDMKYRGNKKIYKYTSCNSQEQRSVLKYVIGGLLLTTATAQRKIASRLGGSTENSRESVFKMVKTGLKDTISDPNLLADYLKNLQRLEDKPFSKILAETQTMAKHLDIPTAPVLTRLASHMTDDEVSDMLRGAHFKIHDQGAIYDLIKSQEDSWDRISSHYPSNSLGSHVGHNEYIFGTKVHMLTGKLTDGSSWFQIEGSPFGFSSLEQLYDSASHSIDYGAYVSTFKTQNVGKLGSSENTEFNPIEKNFILHDPATVGGYLPATQTLLLGS
jgi:hypothetical protein